MKIKYLGHACFVLESGGFRAVLDPFANVLGQKDVCVEAEAVYCSHEHFDHAFVSGVQLTAATRNCEACSCAGAAVREVEASDKSFASALVNPFNVTALESYHDNVQGAKRGPNTIRIFEAEGLRVAHFGDIGCELTEKQLMQLEGLDVAMLPIGGCFTIGPAEAKALYEMLKPAVLIPMHYRSGESGLAEIAALEDFTKQFAKVSELGCDTLELPTEHRGIVVLKSGE